MKVDRAAIYEAAKKLSNWGRWGADDQIGTLNNISAEDVVNAGPPPAQTCASPEDELVSACWLHLMVPGWAR